VGTVSGVEGVPAEQVRKPTMYGWAAADRLAVEAPATLMVGDLRMPPFRDRPWCAWNGHVWEEMVPSRMMKPSSETVPCSRCGKGVSNRVTTVDGGPLIVRAWVECPECVKDAAPSDNERLAAILRRFVARNATDHGYVAVTADEVILDGRLDFDDPADRALLTSLIGEGS
jgi:hypothetical protein